MALGAQHRRQNGSGHCQANCIALQDVLRFCGNGALLGACALWQCSRATSLDVEGPGEGRRTLSRPAFGLLLLEGGAKLRGLVTLFKGLLVLQHRVEQLLRLMPLSISDESASVVQPYAPIPW